MGECVFDGCGCGYVGFDAEWSWGEECGGGYEEDWVGGEGKVIGAVSRTCMRGWS